MTETDHSRRGDGMMRVARSRGALSGLLLVLLGAWGALIPFIGPYFHFAYTPDTAWAWTAGRFWLEVLPGVATVVGGLLIMATANRAVGVFAGYLAAAAGAWFVVGPLLGQLWGGPEGAAGTPTGGPHRQVWEQISFFYGLGAVIVFLAAHALGRFTVRSVRDVRAAERRRERALADTTARDTTARDVTAPTTPAPATTAPATTFAGNRTAAQEEPARVSSSGTSAPATQEIPVVTRDTRIGGTSTGQGATRAGTDGRPQV